MKSYLLLQLFILLLIPFVKSVSTSKNNEKLIYGFFTQTCWNKLFVNTEFDFQCLVFAFSKFIGYGIVFSSSIVKVPQLVNIIRAKSTKGLAELVLYTETFGYMIGLFYPMHYGQPFSTYGESLFICIQAVIILCLLWHFNKKDYPPQRVFVLGGCYSLFALILYDGRLLNDTIWMLLFSVIPQLSNVT